MQSKLSFSKAVASTQPSPQQQNNAASPTTNPLDLWQPEAEGFSVEVFTSSSDLSPKSDAKSPAPDVHNMEKSAGDVVTNADLKQSRTSSATSPTESQASLPVS